MAKAKRQQHPSCKTKRKNSDESDDPVGCFSESELDAAEQLIQLSGDSSSTDWSTNISNKHHQQRREEEIVSDCGTTKVIDMTVGDDGNSVNICDDDDDQDHCFKKINGRDRDRDRDRGDRTICGSVPIRKNKRFKSLSEIYSFTKPLSKIHIL